MALNKKYCNSLKISLLVLFIMFQACSDVVQSPVRSQLSNSSLSTESGINGLLVDGYANFDAFNTNNNIGMDEWCTDIAWETGGGLNGKAKTIVNFTWDPTSVTTGQFVFWQPHYRSIRDANMVLEHVNNLDVSNKNKEEFKAEARFIRAISYYRLWRFFGPVPLRTSTTQPKALPKPGEDKFISFVATELKKVIPNLPKYGQAKQYGRAQKSAARAFLVKLYLNTKQWQEAANIAKVIIEKRHFKLFPSYPDLFKAKNDHNSEYIWVWQMVTSTKAKGNSWMNGAYPPKYKRGVEPFTGAPYKSTTQNWPAQFRLRDKFVNSFNPSDQRLKFILKKYLTNQGDIVSLAGHDNYRSFKYWPDPNAGGGNHGNDIPVIRYADILLSRAEALNEIQGPNQETIDLINKIRTRANLKNIHLSDFGTKASLRDHILKERGWEFYSEGKRRMDLIRMGKFISNAHQRGITRAQSYMTRFPIPQGALYANSKLKQNKGY